MDFGALIKEVGLPVAMALLGLWAIAKGWVIPEPSHKTIVTQLREQLVTEREQHAEQLKAEREQHAAERAQTQQTCAQALAYRDAQIAERDSRLLDSGKITTKLIDLGLRQTVATERTVSAAEKVMGRVTS